MILVLQIALIAVAVAIILRSLSVRSTHSGKAWKKIALVLLAFAMIIAVLNPDMTNTVANLLGVGRGADLLLYGLTCAFIFYALNMYLRKQDDLDTTIRLGRKIAIIEANKRYDIDIK